MTLGCLLRKHFRPFSTNSFLLGTSSASPEPTIRTYYYFLSSHSHLFLQETKHKNFTSAFKDPSFLKFFFRMLRPNSLDPHDDKYQWVSLCRANAGREVEQNLVECELGTPFVFQSIEQDGDESHCLTFANGQFKTPFDPSNLYMDPDGRLCTEFSLKPWTRYSTTMKGVLSDILCNKLQWRIIADEEEAKEAGAHYFLQWKGEEYKVPLREDSWEEKLKEVRIQMHQKGK